MEDPSQKSKERRNEILLGLGSLAAIGLMVAWAMGWVG